ncbi:MAG: hypothetical protein LQ346_000810 [Caloplaca aetnensis]|nr:MAG: hypothetical protein LQ346_000810 [Caloplaca aetnensis]
MSKKKRQREGNLNTHGPPLKKQATSPPVKKNAPMAIPKVPIPANGHRKATAVKQNASALRFPHNTEAEASEKSGYESLDLLEQILLEPPKAHTPSSLPNPNAGIVMPAATQTSQALRELPPLPVIQDSSISEAPFTHQAMLKDAERADRDEAAKLNYERLEFLGDAYLELIASRVILPRFPFFDPGKLSQTRQLLVCNETLADFALRYGFHKRAHLPEEIKRKQDRRERGWVKVMGDIFEAYVAALIICDPQNGFATAEQWLAELWEPILLTKVNPQLADAKAKQTLSTKIMSKGTHLDYRAAGPPEQTSVKGRSLWHVRVYFTGFGYDNVYLGSGKGSNKAEAGAAAAANALEHDMIPALMAKKKESDLVSKVEREQGIADAEKSSCEQTSSKQG